MTATKAEVKHTPLPWILSEEIDDSLTKAAGYPMRWLEGPTDQVCAIPGGNDQSDCDAELIIRAVNSHADLLAACKAALDCVHELASSHHDEFAEYPERLALAEQLEAAIANAES